MPRLIVIRGVDEGKQFDLSAPIVTVGRHSANAVPLHDTQVSRRHLELRAVGGGAYQVCDLGSGNGTLLNGKVVAAANLRSGDTISLGQSVLMYSTGNDAPTGNELTERVRLVAPSAGQDLPSEIIRTVAGNIGSQILSRPEAAATGWLRVRLASLAALYETADAVSHILDVEQLLDKVMDLVLKSVDADHGCFMLRDEDGNLVPKAVRYRTGLNRQEELGVSRTIVDHVLKEGNGVLVTDARTDARFSGGASIHRHNIREVICVPMKGRREPVGVLFLDTQSTLKQFVAGGRENGKFSEDHLHLASAIAHQAAIAVEESRYHQALVNAERLAAIGHTIASLSHHIKNIMQGVRFGSDMVRTAMADDDKDLLGKGWKLVERNQTRIDQLILDMLSYSKEREPLIEPTDMNKLCEDALDVVRGRAGGQGRRHLQAVREHEGVARHRVGVAGQPQDPARARRRHRGPERTRQGQQVYATHPDEVGVHRRLAECHRHAPDGETAGLMLVPRRNRQPHRQLRRCTDCVPESGGQAATRPITVPGRLTF